MDLGNGKLAFAHGVGVLRAVGIGERCQTAETRARVVGCTDLGKEAPVVDEDAGKATGGVDVGGGGIGA